MKRTAMTFSIRFWAIVLIALLIYQFSSSASANECKFEKKIEKTLDLSKSELLSITSAAGDLEVVGVPGTGQAMIHGRVCASKEVWLENTDIYANAGKHAEIGADLPDMDSNWSFGNTYLLVDMHLEVPEDLALDVRDSSGDMLLKNIAEVTIKDSSGDIEVEGGRGPISISDSSGGINIEGAEGDVTIESDSSGDISARDINGSVLVVSDSSGDIDVSRVRDNFVVESDSSGDISASDVDGDFRVLRDGSGSIRINGVKGEIQIPDRG